MRLRDRFFSIPVFLFFLALSLAACGNGNLMGNGNGSPGTAAGALQVADADIAKGQYSAAISVLNPYCPNNNCVNADIANAYANAYIALGNSTSGSSGATITQVLSSVLNLVNGSPSGPQVLQGVDQAVPCLSTNSCSTTYLDNLTTALQALAYTSCSGSSSNASNCPDSSTILLASAMYLLAVAQYETGLVYTNSQWETCSINGGGLSGCTTLTTAQESTIASELVASTTAKNNLANIISILGATYSGSNSGTPTITVGTTNALTALPYFVSSLGTGSTNISQSYYQFMNSLSQCSSNNSASCQSGASGTSASSLSINESGIAWYLAQL